MVEGIYINGELAYCKDYNAFKDIEKSDMAEKLIGHIRRNKKLYKSLIIVTALFLMQNKGIRADEVAQADRFRTLEYKIVDIGSKVMRIACACGFLKDSITSVFQDGDPKGAGRALLKYGMLYACIFLVGWMFDIIEDTLA